MLPRGVKEETNSPAPSESSSRRVRLNDVRDEISPDAEPLHEPVFGDVPGLRSSLKRGSSSASCRSSASSFHLTPSVGTAPIPAPKQKKSHRWRIRADNVEECESIISSDSVISSQLLGSDSNDEAGSPTRKMHPLVKQELPSDSPGPSSKIVHPNLEDLQLGDDDDVVYEGSIKGDPSKPESKETEESRARRETRRARKRERREKERLRKEESARQAAEILRSVKTETVDEKVKRMREGVKGQVEEENEEVEDEEMKYADELREREAMEKVMFEKRKFLAMHTEQAYEGCARVRIFISSKPPQKDRPKVGKGRFGVLPTDDPNATTEDQAEAPDAQEDQAADDQRTPPPPEDAEALEESYADEPVSGSPQKKKMNKTMRKKAKAAAIAKARAVLTANRKARSGHRKPAPEDLDTSFDEDNIGPSASVASSVRGEMDIPLSDSDANQEPQPTIEKKERVIKRRKSHLKETEKLARDEGVQRLFTTPLGPRRAKYADTTDDESVSEQRTSARKQYVYPTRKSRKSETTTPAKTMKTRSVVARGKEAVSRESSEEPEQDTTRTLSRESGTNTSGTRSRGRRSESAGSEPRRLESRTSESRGLESREPEDGEEPGQPITSRRETDDDEIECIGEKPRLERRQSTGRLRLADREDVEVITVDSAEEEEEEEEDYADDDSDIQIILEKKKSRTPREEEEPPASEDHEPESSFIVSNLLRRSSRRNRVASETEGSGDEGEEEERRKRREREEEERRKEKEREKEESRRKKEERRKEKEEKRKEEEERRKEEEMRRKEEKKEEERRKKEEKERRRTRAKAGTSPIEAESVHDLIEQRAGKAEDVKKAKEEEEERRKKREKDEAEWRRWQREEEEKRKKEEEEEQKRKREEKKRIEMYNEAKREDEKRKKEEARKKREEDEKKEEEREREERKKEKERREAERKAEKERREEERKKKEEEEEKKKELEKKTPGRRGRPSRAAKSKGKKKGEVSSSYTGESSSMWETEESGREEEERGEEGRKEEKKSPMKTRRAVYSGEESDGSVLLSGQIGETSLSNSSLLGMKTTEPDYEEHEESSISTLLSQSIGNLSMYEGICKRPLEENEIEDEEPPKKRRIVLYDDGGAPSAVDDETVKTSARDHGVSRDSTTGRQSEVADHSVSYYEEESASEAANAYESDEDEQNSGYYFVEDVDPPESYPDDVSVPPPDYESGEDQMERIVETSPYALYQSSGDDEEPIVRTPQPSSSLSQACQLSHGRDAAPSDNEGSIDVVGDDSEDPTQRERIVLKFKKSDLKPSPVVEPVKRGRGRPARKKFLECFPTGNDPDFKKRSVSRASTARSSTGKEKNVKKRMTEAEKLLNSGLDDEKRAMKDLEEDNDSPNKSRASRIKTPKKYAEASYDDDDDDFEEEMYQKEKMIEAAPEPSRPGPVMRGKAKIINGVSWDVNDIVNSFRNAFDKHPIVIEKRYYQIGDEVTDLDHITFPTLASGPIPIPQGVAHNGEPYVPIEEEEELPYYSPPMYQDCYEMGGNEEEERIKQEPSDGPYFPLPAESFETSEERLSPSKSREGVARPRGGRELRQKEKRQPIRANSESSSMKEEPQELDYHRSIETYDRENEERLEAAGKRRETEEEVEESEILSETTERSAEDRSFGSSESSTSSEESSGDDYVDEEESRKLKKKSKLIAAGLEIPTKEQTESRKKKSVEKRPSPKKTPSVPVPKPVSVRPSPRIPEPVVSDFDEVELESVDDPVPPSPPSPRPSTSYAKAQLPLKSAQKKQRMQTLEPEVSAPIPAGPKPAPQRMKRVIKIDWPSVLNRNKERPKSVKPGEPILYVTDLTTDECFARLKARLPNYEGWDWGNTLTDIERIYSGLKPLNPDDPNLPTSPFSDSSWESSSESEPEYDSDSEFYGSSSDAAEEPELRQYEMELRRDEEDPQNDLSVKNMETDRDRELVEEREEIVERVPIPDHLDTAIFRDFIENEFYKEMEIVNFTMEEQNEMTEYMIRCEEGLYLDEVLSEYWNQFDGAIKDLRHRQILETAFAINLCVVRTKRMRKEARERWELHSDQLDLLFEADRMLGIHVTDDAHSEIYYTIGNKSEEADLEALKLERGSARFGRECKNSYIKFRRPWLPEIFIGRSILKDENLTDDWRKLMAHNGRPFIYTGFIDVRDFEGYARYTNRLNYVGRHGYIFDALGITPEYDKWRTCTMMLHEAVKSGIESAKTEPQQAEERREATRKRELKGFMKSGVILAEDEELNELNGDEEFNDEPGPSNRIEDEEMPYDREE